MLNIPWALLIALAIQSAPSSVSTSAGQAPDRPLTHLVQNLGHDLRNLPSQRSASIAVAGSVGSLLAHSAGDESVASWAKGAGLASYADVGDVLGNGWTQGGAALVTYTIGAIGHQLRVKHIGSDLIRAQVLNGVLTTALKVGVDRQRPAGGTHGFPSGHTSAAFATAAVLDGHFGLKAAIPMYTLASFIGWTRVRDNVHYLSDVVVGASIGVVVGRTVSAGHKPRKWTIAPAPAAGGAGVTFLRTW